MHIMKLGNYSVLLNQDYGVKKNNSVSTPNFGAHVNKDLFVRTLYMSKYLIKDSNGNLPIHKADLDKMLEIHKALKDQPEVIAQMYLTKNSDGNLPIHTADLDKMLEIHKALKDQSEVIAKMHLTKDSYGNLPIHYASPYLNIIQEIHSALKNQPEVIAQMHLTKNKYGNLPMHYASPYLNIIQEILSVLEDKPKVIAKILLTKDRCDSLPLNYSDQSRKEAKVIHRVIVNAALNSDLDVKTSIELLEKYNHDDHYSDAIEELKKQL